MVVRLITLPTFSTTAMLLLYLASFDFVPIALCRPAGMSESEWMAGEAAHYYGFGAHTGFEDR